jgi:hypothetical protein
MDGLQSEYVEAEVGGEQEAWEEQTEQPDQDVVAGWGDVMEEIRGRAEQHWTPSRAAAFDGDMDQFRAGYSPREWWKREQKWRPPGWARDLTITTPCAPSKWQLIREKETHGEHR